MRAREGTTALVVGGIGILGCQALVSSDVVQCSSNADCERRGGSFANTQCVSQVCVQSLTENDGGSDAASNDPLWGCVGNVSWGTESPGERIHVRRRILRVVQGAPIVGARVLACGVRDPDCASPFAETKSTDDGSIELDLPKNFRGYLHLPEPPEQFPDMIPHLIQVLPPPDKDSADGPIGVLDTFLIVSLPELNVLLSQVGLSPDPSLGYVTARVLDCAAQPAAGISLRASVRATSTATYYIPSSGVPSTTLQQTDESGFAGFVNLPPGSVDVEALLLDRALRTARLTTLIKKGARTILTLPVTP